MFQIIPIPIFLLEKEKCIIQEGIRYCEQESTTLKELGVLLLVVALWGAGLFMAAKFTDEKFDNPLIGIFIYFVLTALLFIFL